MSVILHALALALTLALFIASPALNSEADPGLRAVEGRLLVVSPSGPYTSIGAALVDARDGDTIEVRGGVYQGPLVVNKSVTLRGIDWPVIDNGERGTVVTLASPGAVLQGFEVRGSGVEPDQDHAGVILTAPRTRVEGNRLRDVLFGIFVDNARDAVVRGNDITSKPEYEQGRKGDGIRVWYSPDTLVEANTVHDTRDVVIWYSEGVVLRQNIIERGRYGVHLMFCNRARIEGNQLLDNSVGVYTMYSDDTVMRANLIRGQRGPSGYALGFKDSVNVDARENVLVDNRAGVFLDNTPFGQGYARFDGNALAFNDVGVILLTNARGSTFTGNTFWENVEQVSIQGQGGATSSENTWLGNYWSDYTGFDADNDGRGDVPYHSERLFENLTDRVPSLRALIYSPAVQALEFASATFPVIRPLSKLTDPAPITQPAPLPDFTAAQHSDAAGMAEIAVLLLAGSGLCAVFAMRAGGKPTSKNNNAPGDPTARTAMILQAEQLTKRYGKTEVLRQVSFETQRGEALALWGPNGAGKTTLMKAILGLLDYQGRIQVDGHDARRDGKRARRNIGYVPQEVLFYDWSVQATMAFYATLRKAEASQITALLTQMGLDAHVHKSVPALSGGLRQRLALAVALLGNPPILLLDEPMANLDAQARTEYRTLLAKLHRQGKTILFATHRLEEVETLADRVLVLEQGELKAILTPAALRVSLAGEVDMTLWMPAAQHAAALACLNELGVPAHLNGRGTVVARIGADRKVHLLRVLAGSGIEVSDFELELARRNPPE